VGLERGPLSLVSTIEELLGRYNSGSGLESRKYGRGESLRLPRNTLYLQNLALTSPTIDGRSVGIVRSRTKATELLLLLQTRLARGPIAALALGRSIGRAVDFGRCISFAQWSDASRRA
jgi:hypothetical protein